MQFTVMLDGEAAARRTAQQEIESLTGLSFQDLKDSSVKTWRNDTSVET